MLRDMESRMLSVCLAAHTSIEGAQGVGELALVRDPALWLMPASDLSG